MNCYMIEAQRWWNNQKKQCLWKWYEIMKAQLLKLYLVL